MRFVYRNGKTVRGPLTSLKYAPNKRRESYRLAVVVSRKVNKSAVVRNRIRRRIYESVRLVEPQITGSYDMVMTIFHEQITELSHDELTRLVGAQLKQARIISAPTNNDASYTKRTQAKKPAN